MHQENNFYISFSNVKKEDIKKAFEGNGWNSRKSSWTDFELTNSWSKLILEGDESTPLLNGAVDFLPENINVLDKIFKDLKGGYEYEFYDKNQNLVFQSCRVNGDQSVHKNRNDYSLQHQGVYFLKSILFCVVFTGFLVILSSAKSFVPPNFERLAHGVVGTIAGILATVIFLKFDKKKFSDIGLRFDRNTIVKFFAGVVIGIIIMGILAAGVLYFTKLEVTVNPKSNFFNFVLMTSPLILLAFMEELGFRAYPLEILKDKIGIRLAIIITSLLFALYHLVNGWSIASIFYGPAIWGLIFGLSAIYAKGIAMPTGIHYAANLTTSSLGEPNNAVSIWIVQKPDSATAKYAGIDWITVLPSIALLVFAVICIEIYMRRRNTNTALAKHD